MHYVDAKGILSAHNGMNIYRGCTHGCIYCDSRSECYQMNHGFEDIEVKRNAPELLEKALKSKRRLCMIGTGAMCDPYMQCEDEVFLMRRCLEIISRHGFGVTVQTKSARVLRDIDLLREINNNAKAVVQMTLTTYDESLCRIIEPNVSTTRERFDALMTLKENSIPTVVWLTPILPFINDTEENLRGILDYCFRAGVRGIILFGMGVTLRRGNREYFYNALERCFPGVKEKYVKTFKDSYECKSPNSHLLYGIFTDECKRHGVLYTPQAVFDYLGEFPDNAHGEQLKMF